MVLLRRVIGDALRARRQAQHRTLREVSTAANVSLGYLSEIERGQKEASSELLAAICEALGAALSEVLRDVSEQLATSEERAMPVSEPAPEPVPAAEARIAAQPTASIAALAERKLSVAVHRDGLLKTTLRATRTTSAEDREPVYV
jgi:transcriptional regulator with XRE-family HTH domain